MVENTMGGLPKGFFDTTGELASQYHLAIEDFYKTGNKFGFRLSYPSEVGFQSTYLNFGTAAKGRCYCFQDLGNNAIMLSSDSLATCIRQYLGSPECGKINRVMAKTPVFRYKHKKYRRFNHLVYTIFQEKDEISATLALFKAAHCYLSHYYDNLEYDIYLYGIFEEAVQILNRTHEQIFDVLFSKSRYGEGFGDSEIAAFIQEIETVGLNSKSWHEAFHNLSEMFPRLEPLLDRYSIFFDVLDEKKIKYHVMWRDYRAVEYSSGICFIVKDEKDTLADGGSYTYIVNKLNPSILTCYSFACSVESLPIKDTQPINGPNIIYVIKLDCSLPFFLRTADMLRDEGYNIHELVSSEPLRKTLRELPKQSKVVVVGMEEEKKQKVIVDGQLFSVV